MLNAFLFTSFCEGVWSLCKMAKAHSQATPKPFQPWGNPKIYESQTLGLQGHKDTYGSVFVDLGTPNIGCYQLVPNLPNQINIFFHSSFQPHIFPFEIQWAKDHWEPLFCSVPIELHSKIQHFSAFLNYELKQFVSILPYPPFWVKGEIIYCSMVQFERSFHWAFQEKCYFHSLNHPSNLTWNIHFYSWIFFEIGAPQQMIVPSRISKAFSTLEHIGRKFIVETSTMLGLGLAYCKKILIHFPLDL